jgi:anthranilate synthase component 2
MACIVQNIALGIFKNEFSLLLLRGFRGAKALAQNFLHAVLIQNNHAKMKILVLDNYDSFTYNLVQYLREIEAGEVSVFRNDAILVEQVDDYDCIVLSPGPGVPSYAGLMPEIIKKYHDKKPILGVCLGHQAIGEAFGGALENMKEVYHGVATDIEVRQADGLYQGLPTELPVGRYHSWVIRPDACPDCLEVTATSADGSIMSVRHKELPVFGVQYHPESIMTPQGKAILLNFLRIVRQHIPAPQKSES